MNAWQNVEIFSKACDGLVTHNLERTARAGRHFSGGRTLEFLVVSLALDRAEKTIVCPSINQRSKNFFDTHVSAIKFYDLDF